MKAKQKGFTLIELMVVMAIIAVLVGMVLVAINPAKLIGEARDGRTRSDLNQVKTALQLYYNENNVYPSALSTTSTPAVFYPTYMKAAPSETISYEPSPASCTTACDDYKASVDLDYPNTDDSSSKTKCSYTGTNDYVVCPD